MAISYKFLFAIITKKETIKMNFTETDNILTNIMIEISKKKVIHLKNLEKVCTAISFTPNDAIEFANNEK